MCYIFFFFQAEDGIRDIGVTGVQTCALPIYRKDMDLTPYPPSLTGKGGPVAGNRPRGVYGRAGFRIFLSSVPGLGRGLLPTRSEERRVGKECRSRWSPYH